MRATAKWTVTALGAVGVALLGAAPLTAVGKIHGIGQAAEAFAGLVVGLVGIGWAIWRTTDALMPPVTTLTSLSSPELTGLRDEIAANSAEFFGPFGNSVRDLENASVFWQAAGARATVMLATEDDDKRKRRLAQAVSDAQANAAQAGARLRWLLEFTHAWRVREQLRRARLHAFAGAAVTALGAMIFVAATTRLPRRNAGIRGNSMGTDAGDSYLSPALAEMAATYSARDLGGLAAGLLKFVRQSGDQNGLHDVILLLRQLTGNAAPDEPERQGWLANLSVALQLRFEANRQQTDLDEAIARSREAVSATPPGTLDAVINLAGLFSAERSRWQLTANPADLDEMISAGRSAAAAAAAAPGYARIAALYSVLAIGLRARSMQPPGHEADFDEAIGYFRLAADAAVSGDPSPGSHWYNLAMALRERYDQHRDVSDLDAAVDAARGGLAATPPADQARAEQFSMLGKLLEQRYVRTADRADIDAAIEAARGAVTAAGPDGEYWAAYISNLGIFLKVRAERTGSAADLDEGIAHMRAGRAGVDPAGAAFNLAGALYLRAERSKDPGDLDEAIREARLAVDAAGPPGAQRARSLYNLGVALKLRFLRTRNQADISAAVQALAEAAELTAHGSSAGPDPAERTGILSVLGSVQMERFGVSGEPAELDEAVANCRAAVAMTARSADSRLRVVALANLSSVLATHYRETGDLGELDEAIRLTRDVLDAMPPDHPEYAAHRSDVASRLRARFWRSGDLADLEEAIDQGRAALAAATADAPDRGRYETDLAGAFHARYWRTGALADLDEAIRGLRAAVACTPAGWQARPEREANLAMGLKLRANRTGSRTDLDEAISGLRAAVGEMTAGHPLRALYLSELGAAFLSRFTESGDLADLNEGIRHLAEGVEATPQGEPNRGVRLSNLSTAVQLRFRRTGDPRDLDVAVQVGRDALAASPPDHPSRATTQAGLAAKLLIRFEHSGNRADLAESVTAGRAAVAASPAGHPDRAVCLSILGDALWASPGPQRAEAFACWRAAAGTGSAPAWTRINAAVSWGDAAAGEGLTELAEEGFSVAAGLLPLLAWRGLDRGSQEQQLARRPGLASDATACAIAAGHPEHAVELLEHGRTILWSQLLQLRGQLDDLRRAAPGLADRLDAIRAGLDPSGGEQDLVMPDAGGTAPRGGAGPVPRRDQADERMRLSGEWDEAVDEVRRLPGFAGFLDIPSFAELAAAVDEGPAVIVNVSRFGCHALAVSAAGPEVIPLPGLTAADATARANEFLDAVGRLSEVTSAPPADRSDDPHRVIQGVLGWLWDTVAQPVLTALELTGTEADGPLPRLWWCPTGPMTVLPLHAAGRDAGGRVLDHVVSSYIPTLRALRDARTRPVPDADPRMLLVTMPETPYLPGGAPLRGVADEAAIVARHFVPRATHLTEDTATVTGVLGALGRAQYAHFACHGGVNPAEPTRGGLYLYDGPLTIRQLSEKDLPGAELAFLSACQSATGSLPHLDEAITMAAGLQLAGFRHVIATLWSISDTAAPDVARAVYGALTGPGDGRREAGHSARALHGAVRQLRAAGQPPAQWAPFIHSGP